MADDAVLCADIGKLSGGHFAGVCALFVLGNILSAGGDLGFLTGLDHGGDHNCRSAEDDVAGSGSRHGRAQRFHEGLDLRGEHFGKMLRMDDKDCRLATLCGMSACRI